MQGTENRKIKNAHPLEYAGIQFKSKLEKKCYTSLIDNGLKAEYEPVKYVIWEGFKPTIPFYSKDGTTRQLKKNNKKIISISYTPDFVFEHNGHTIIIECKGFQNDLYPVKRKLFRGWLEKHLPNSIYFEIYTHRQLMEAIAIIKNLKDDDRKDT